MKLPLLPLSLFLLLAVYACGSTEIDATTETIEIRDENPPADGFDATGSDERAIAIADSVVKHHGGRQAFDNARFFKWNFFGARTLTWDKEEDRVRIEVPEKQIIYLLDYSDDDLTGAVRKEGVEMTNPDSLAIYLQSANSMFINDSYWLIQPFKLKDSGVTLKYIGEETDPKQQRPSEVIELTFKDVGDTPGNRYRLFVDKETYRINTWQFFRNAADEAPAMETPFNGYREYSGILISGDRGGRAQLTDIEVTDSIPESVFTQF
ncbi:hypothetical protein GGR28_000502 [Lewinella aquimaris]|uniref:Outer membrane lipoprotein-sorting protein n=1 Tax=Neolewinella aquimaris TaxID=1835722 RepID=A0A840DY41_9BACT|nr:hypothetical protein [Neolewinella aquimaris]MBB4077901.1 hypothetical protein [Neolewinella aquimaris]